MSIRAFIGALGAVFVLIGLVLFVIPVSVTVAGETGRCDSSAPFGGVPDDLGFNNRAYEDFQDQCADAISTRHGWSWGLMGVGVVVVLGSLGVRRPDAADPSPAS